jgi:hypothetical protein
MKIHPKRLWPAIGIALIAAFTELQKTQGHDPRWAVGLAVGLAVAQSLMPSAVVRRSKQKDDKETK